MQNKNDIKRLGTIMGIWAHPDDEVMSMCGIMCAALGNGQEVVCITATRGEAGVQDETRWPAKKLAAIRGRELRDAYRLIGITHHHFLDYPDGGCQQADENQAVQRLVSLIAAYRPDTILTFGPDGMTGHPDHQAVSRWAGLAAARAGQGRVYHAILTDHQYQALEAIDEKFNFFFNIDKPRTCQEGACTVRFELDDPLFACKLACLRAMPSQYESLMAAFGTRLRPSLGTEAFIMGPRAGQEPH